MVCLQVSVEGRKDQEADKTITKKNEKVSRALSWLLRHGAEKERLALTPGGWAKLDDILKRPQFQQVTIEHVKEVVKDCPKQRFALREDDGELYIRANQGHTIQVEELELQEITSSDECPEVVHGTYYQHWKSIKERGLSRMKRNHIHMAPGLPGGSEVISGMRSSCTVFVHIDLAKALAAGFKFYRSANNVILCPGNESGYLPSEYFLKAVCKKTGKNLM